MTPRPRRDILICGYQFADPLKSGAMSILELAPIAAKLGVQGVEYRPIYWKDKARELPVVRDQMHKLGLKAAYATFTTLFNSDPAKQVKLMQDLEDAHALGAPFMRVFRGVRPWGAPEEPAMLDAARSAIDRAGQYGMRLALENFGGAPGDRLSDILETLAMLDSPVMGTNVDTSNYARWGDDVVEAIHTLAPQIIYCHFKDAKRTETEVVSTYIGDGVLPIPEIVAALDEVGRHFPICFEFPVRGDPIVAITKSLAYLATL